MVTVVVLINLLIAMMSDTYQRIQAKSDTEWKFGLAKLIRNMSRTSGTPSPLNLLVKFIVYIIAIFKFKCKSNGHNLRMLYCFREFWLLEYVLRMVNLVVVEEIADTL